MRTPLALFALVAALLLGVPTALATTGSGSGGGVTVTASLPDTVAVGSQLTVAETIANTTSTSLFVRVTQTLHVPSGKVYSVSYPLFIPSHRSLAFSFAFTVPAVQTGAYTLTFAAKTASGTASATASSMIS